MLARLPTTSRSALYTFSRAFSSARVASNAASSSSTAAELNAAAASAPAAELAEEFDNLLAARQARPAYFVERSAGGALPVYTDIRNGGNNVRTLVRKVQGNAQALRDDLSAYLADGHIDPLSPPPAVVVRPTSQQVEIKGRWTEEVKGWLEARGF